MALSDCSAFLQENVDGGTENVNYERDNSDGSDDDLNDSHAHSARNRSMIGTRPFSTPLSPSKRVNEEISDPTYTPFRKSF